MRIGELSARTGASRRSLRYYEEQGLVGSSRASSGQRHYDEDQIERVRLIQSFFAAGLSSRVILGMVPCMTTTPTLPAAQRSMEIMITERARLDEAIEGLHAARAALENLIKENRFYQAGLACRSSR